MSLKGRLAALERRLGVRGGRLVCKCRDDARKVVLFYDDEPVPEVQETVCERCGGIQEPQIVHVVHEGWEPAREDTPHPGPRRVGSSRARRKNL